MGAAAIIGGLISAGGAIYSSKKSADEAMDRLQYSGELSEKQFAENLLWQKELEQLQAEERALTRELEAEEQAKQKQFTAALLAKQMGVETEEAAKARQYSAAERKAAGEYAEDVQARNLETWREAAYVDPEVLEIEKKLGLAELAGMRSGAYDMARNFLAGAGHGPGSGTMLAKAGDIERGYQSGVSNLVLNLKKMGLTPMFAPPYQTSVYGGEIAGDFLNPTEVSGLTGDFLSPTDTSVDDLLESWDELVSGARSTASTEANRQQDLIDEPEDDWDTILSSGSPSQDPAYQFVQDYSYSQPYGTGIMGYGMPSTIGNDMSDMSYMGGGVDGAWW